MTMKSIVIAICPGPFKPILQRIESSPLGSRLARGTFWSLSGAVVARGLALAASILIARRFGKVGFGEFGIIQTTIGMFGIFAGFGLGLTATKHVAEFRTKDPAKVGRIMALSGLVAVVTGGVMAIALVLLADWLAEHTLAAPHLAGLLRIGAMMLFLDALNGAQIGALSGFEAFKTIARVNVAAGVIVFVVLIVGAYAAGLTGAVWGLVISRAANWLLNHLALRREAARFAVPMSFARCTAEWSILWRFSLPSVLASMLMAPVTWACTTMLVNQPNGYAEMGVFNAANQWFMAILFLPAIVGQVVLPILSERIGSQGAYQSARVLLLSIKVNALAAGLLIVVASLLSPWIMGAYGPEFGNAWLTLIVVVLTAGLLAIQAPVGQLMIASNNIWWGGLMNLGWAVMFLGCTWMWSTHGAIGIASARLVAYIVHATWTFLFAAFYVRRHQMVSPVAMAGSD